MPVIKRIVHLVLPIAAMLALLGAGGTYYYQESGLAGSRGRLPVSGLAAPVEVIRDRWGVPHIYAQSEHDLYFAQGYVQAQDRLWQMDECRRAALGTLAEVLGPEAVAGDRLARTLGFARAAEEEWKTLDPETRVILEAYAEGVNAYLASPGRQLPPEFGLLRYAPEPWKPADTLAWARLYAWSQEASWQEEVVRARLIEAVGVDRAAELDDTIGQSPISASQLEGLAACTRPLLMEGIDQIWPWASEAGAGGVAWVVDGTHTAGGGPILAAAPRTPVQMPSSWYEMHLVGGRYDVAGATLPGIPGVVIGRNRTIAWSLAGSGVDSTDLYVERVQVGDAPRVLYQGRWESVQVREEEIRVRGQSEPVSLHIYSTRHGAIVSSLEDGQELQVAVRWLGAEQGSALTRSLPALNRAGNWSEAQAALARWGTPGEMLVYADAQGIAAYACAGAAPVRTTAGTLPQPGWTGEYEWQGVAQGKELPQSLQRSAGLLVAVDGQASVRAGSEATGGSGPDDFAARRIAELTQSAKGLTVEDGWRVLCDDAGPEQPLLSLLLNQAPQGWVQERTAPYLRRWDGHYDRESAGAGVYEAFFWRLAHNVLDDELGAVLVDAYLNTSPSHRAALATLAADADGLWLDDGRTPQREGRDELLARSLAEALDGLGRRFGDLPYEWNWGRVHSITFAHTLGSRWPLTVFLNRGAMRAGGGEASIDAVLPDYGRRMVVGSAPTYRLVVDLSEGGETVAVNAPGQSGNPLSPHYADMIEPWRDGRYHSLLLERQDIVSAARATLVLTPAGSR